MPYLYLPSVTDRSTNSNPGGRVTRSRSRGGPNRHRARPTHTLKSEPLSGLSRSHLSREPSWCSTMRRKRAASGMAWLLARAAAQREEQERRARRPAARATRRARDEAACRPMTRETVTVMLDVSVASAAAAPATRTVTKLAWPIFGGSSTRKTETTSVRRGAGSRPRPRAGTQAQVLGSRPRGRARGADSSRAR